MRGTTNGNARGNTRDREARRVWLLKTWSADRYVILQPVNGEAFDTAKHVVQACRCWRCGTLLTLETVTVDRIVPGCRGGTYKRNNIRPACGACNSQTGGAERG